MCNDFSKVFDKTVDQNAITSSCKTKKRNCHRDSMMWDAEIMSILILSPFRITMPETLLPQLQSTNNPLSFYYFRRLTL